MIEFIISVVLTVCFVFAVARFVWVLWTACEHIEKMWQDAEHTRYDVKSIERHICREVCGGTCKHE